MPQKRDRKLSKRALTRREAGGLTPVGGSNLRPLQMSTPMNRWPVHECLAPVNWTEPGELVQVIVARVSDDGEYAVANFLCDLGCLGVKDAYTARFTDSVGYSDWLRDASVGAPWTRIELDLAAKIVRTAIDYAGSLGFRPHRDYATAAPFLRDANPDAAEEEVPIGKDGKPFFVNGPFDNVPKIVAQLDRKVGPGNYQLVLGGPPGAILELDTALELLDDVVAIQDLGNRGRDRD